MNTYLFSKISASLNVVNIYGTSEWIHKPFRHYEYIFKVFQTLRLPTWDILASYLCLTRDHSVLQRSSREPSLSVLCTSFYVFPVPFPAPHKFPAFDTHPFPGSSLKFMFMDNSGQLFRDICGDTPLAQIPLCWAGPMPPQPPDIRRYICRVLMASAPLSRDAWGSRRVSQTAPGPTAGAEEPCRAQLPRSSLGKLRMPVTCFLLCVGEIAEHSSPAAPIP